MSEAGDRVSKTLADVAERLALEEELRNQLIEAGAEDVGLLDLERIAAELMAKGWRRS